MRCCVGCVPEYKRFVEKSGQSAPRIRSTSRFSKANNEGIATLAVLRPSAFQRQPWSQHPFQNSARMRPKPVHVDSHQRALFEIDPQIRTAQQIASEVTEQGLVSGE